MAAFNPLPAVPAPAEASRTRAPREGDVLQRDVSIEFRRSSDDTRSTFIINTDRLDTYGTVIDPAGGDLSRYLRNPVVLINHDHDRPVATSNISIRDNRLVADVPDDAWDDEDPEALRWFRKVKKGIVRGASIGFRILPGGLQRVVDEQTGAFKFYRITKWELLEWSIVTVPSNADAVVIARAADTEGEEPDGFRATLEALRAEIAELRTLVVLSAEPDPEGSRSVNPVSPAPAVPAPSAVTTAPVPARTAPVYTVADAERLADVIESLSLSHTDDNA